MNQTVTFTNGFDMDKYLSNFVATDFILADAAYFQTGAGFGADATVPEEIIDTVTAQGGITESGRVYGRTTPVQEFVTEDYFRQSRSLWNDEETVNQMLASRERNADGRVQDTAQIFGMEPFALDHLKVLEEIFRVCMNRVPGRLRRFILTTITGIPRWIHIGRRLAIR